MLFDLQSPRRRRVVQIVFGGLAVIFAISFVFLGVGTGGGGSIGDLFGGGGSADPTSAFDDQISAAEDQLAANPNDPNAYATLVQLHYSAGRTGVDENGALTSDGQQDLQQGVDAWNKYLKATKNQPAPGPATFAVLSFDALAATAFQEARTSTSNDEALTNVNIAVADWKAAAQAQQFLVTDNPTSSNYVKLAYYLYLSGDIAGGDQAANQAKSAKGAQDPASIDQQLKSVKQLGTQLQTAIKQLTKQQQATQGAGATGGGATGGGSNPLGGLGGGTSGTGALGGG